MNERDSLYDTLSSYLQSDTDKKQLKRKIKKRHLIEHILKLKSLYEDQQSLLQVIEHQLQELLKTVSGLKEKEPTEEQEIQETHMNEKILRKSLDVLEKDNKISREILAIGEHYKVDIYKLNWNRINNLIKHQGKPIEEYKDVDIPTNKIKKIKSLVAKTLSEESEV